MPAAEPSIGASDPLSPVANATATPAHRLLIGTAGHVDHGKTSLVKALTGVDCDRWREEKVRGITIDIGFAHLVRGDVELGFVDVPGHQRFVHNALAGLGGIRAMLLVVAADEGVKPQTREHLAICALLGIPRALVALTKVDLVEPDLLELARVEVSELLAGTAWADAPIFPVASPTGQGLAALEAALVELARALPPPAAANLPARLPIDRAFHLKGLGVVVTGTLAAGSLAVGDSLDLLPGQEGARPLQGRIRSLQVHGTPRERATTGERTAVQLAGIELADLARGAELTAAEAYRPTRLLAAEITLLPDAAKPLQGFVDVRVHLYAGEALGRMRALDPAVIAPGERGLVEIRLAQPLVAVRGDRVVVRRPSPATTLGGGEVLDPQWPRRRGRALAALLAPLRQGPPALLAAWVADAGEVGIGERELAQRLGWPRERLAAALQPILGKATLMTVGTGAERRLVAPAAFRTVRERAKAILSEFLARERLAPGMPKAELLRRLFPLRSRRAESLLDAYVAWLEADRVLVVAGDLVNPPGRRAALSAEESKLEAALVARYEAAGLEPPSPGSVALELGTKPQIVDGLVRYLVQRGRLSRLPGDLFIATGVVDALRRDLLATGWERFSVPQFKERFGLSRKWAIPLLEHLDGLGVSRRVGDERLLLRPR